MSRNDGIITKGGLSVIYQRGGIILLVLVFCAAVGRAEIKSAFLKKAGRKAHQVKSILTEPVTNPRGALNRWFAFDPAVESGEKKNFNVLPLFVSSPERGQGLGVKFAVESLARPKDIFHVQAVHTLKDKSSFKLKYIFPPDPPKWLGLEFETGYENYSRFYYGLGNRSQKEDESNYTPEFYYVRVPWLIGIHKKFYAGISTEYQNWKIPETDPNGILPRDLPSLYSPQKARLWITGALLRWDNRDHPTNSTRGAFAETRFEYFHKMDSLEEDFTRTSAEARAFFPLFKNSSAHVLAFRIHGDYRPGQVPFYQYPELGGIFYNRGLIEGRFRDHLLISGNCEYRVRIYERLHWAFFIDAGSVFSEFSKVRPANSAKITGGSGMRYYVPPGNLLLARIDGGISSEGFLVYLTFEQPF